MLHSASKNYKRNEPGHPGVLPDLPPWGQVWQNASCCTQSIDDKKGYRYDDDDEGMYDDGGDGGDYDDDGGEDEDGDGDEALWLSERLCSRDCRCELVAACIFAPSHSVIIVIVIITITIIIIITIVITIITIDLVFVIVITSTKKGARMLAP